MASGPEHEIRRRISRHGQITFQEFMELALYWPHGGYYASRRAHVSSGDYYTAPAAHPVFGALIGVQICQMWQLMGRPSSFWVVEAGAGSGLLCHDLVSFAEAIGPDFCQALRYLCLERNPTPGHEAQLPSALRSKVDRVAANALPFRGLVGCVVSNELLDSFPVHRVTVRDGRLRELYVTLDGEELVETEGALSTPELERRLERVGVSLEEGWQAEINLDLDGWVAAAARALEQGYVVTVDYGRPAADLYSAQRQRGTLTTFRRHVQTDDPFHHIGEQDITAQVDFTALELAGRESGLDAIGATNQRQFLFNLGIDQWVRRLPREEISQAEGDANRMGMQQLVRPGGMGDFRVLVQTKSVKPSPLWGLQRSAAAENLVAGLPMPRLTQLHAPLLQARYPHRDWHWEQRWPAGRDQVD